MFPKKSILIVVATVILTIAIASPADAQRRASAQVGSECAGGIDALFDEIALVPLSDYEETALLYLWEEEKLARDVYDALFDIWQLPIFSNIARAEQRHMNLVWKLIEAYEIANPFTDDTPGIFTDPTLTPLFDDFVAAGEVSLIDALWVGADIEDMDLYDLYEILENAENDHIELVAYNLAKGSRNHLRAFVRALSAQGETYTPTYLSQDTVDEIVDAGMEQRILYNADGEPIEACGGAIGGFGQRRGPGDNGGNGGQGNGPGSSDGGNGNGECDGSGSSDGGNRNGNGNGEHDGTGSNNGGNGNGECDGSGSNGGGNGNGGGTGGGN